MRAPDHDPELDAFFRDAVTHLDRVDHEARAAGERPRPDFREVVARAHRLDPAVIDADKVEESGHLAPVVPLAASLESSAADPDLDAFVAGVRQASDAAIGERRLAGIPAPSFAAAPPRRRVLPAALATLAVAAAALLVLLPRGAEIRLQSAPPALMQRALGAARAVEEQVHLRTGPKEQVPKDMSEETAMESLDPADPPVPPPVDDAEDELAGPAEETSAPEAPVAGERPSRRATERKAEREAEREAELAALDADAQARWRRGDREGAEAGFRALIERDPRGRWAQLAYGDLFALARQRGDEAAELALWREYLRRYPRGAHSDDAHAGVCRRSDGQARTTCWREYLEQRPAGAFRAQAERALADAPGDAP
ncbi:MAG: hypothetical protein R3B09_14280 [Nannocystaceae bacterium]